MKSFWLKLLLPQLAGLLILSCVTGGGTDVGNALVEGKVLDEGRPVVMARVILMPADYNPVMGDSLGRVRSVRSKKDGSFTISGLSAGKYSLEVLHQTDEKMDWVSLLDLEGGERQSIIFNLDFARTLSVKLPDNRPSRYYVYIPGTSVYSMQTKSPSDSVLQLFHVPNRSIPSIRMGSMDDPDFSVTIMDSVSSE